MDKQTQKIQKTPAYRSTPQESQEATRLLLYTIIDSGCIKLTVFEKSIFKVYYGINETKDDRRYARYVKPEYRPLYLEQAMNKVTGLISSIPKILSNQKDTQEENTVLRKQNERLILKYCRKNKKPDMQPKNLLNTPIRDTPLPSRIKAICEREEFYYVKDLVLQNPERLYLLKGMGKKSINAIIELLAEDDLHLGMNLE